MTSNPVLVEALRGGRSLLPAGVMAVEGDFRRGDPIVVRDPDGRINLSFVEFNGESPAGMAYEDVLGARFSQIPVMQEMAKECDSLLV